MGETEISWTHRPGTVGRSWNPVQGCRMVSPGCEHCYAQRMAARFAVSGWSQGLINLKTKKWNGESRLATHKLSEPLGWRKPATVFVNSMSDLFYEGFSNEQIAAVFGVMAAAPHHTFQVLTKRAKRMREWFDWMNNALPMKTLGYDPRPLACWDFTKVEAPHIASSAWDSEFMSRGHLVPWPLPNVWLGVSVENQAAADERIPELCKTPAAIRFLSCEPLLGPLDLMRHLRCSSCGYSRLDCNEHLDHHLCKGPGPGLSWVIAGCELRAVAKAVDAKLRSKRKGAGLIDLPYLDGKQHAAFPTVTP